MSDDLAKARTDDLADARATALDYLHAELGARAPAELLHCAWFDESPLDGEGRAAVFRFSAEVASTFDPRCSSPSDFYVVAGRTTPNYFPAYGLDADDAYSLHVGTRFMLEMRVGLIDSAAEPPAARDALRALIAEVAPGANLTRLDLAALFRADDSIFAVYSADIDGERVYVFGADCPPGFYRRPDLPPQAVLRLHLGKLIRAERDAPAA
ncbi:MAG: hypothetical protein CHACPFDD_01647 [Phycisphaerae bacterium]|nr:hypothetical protein [Phycisphaerae bacterium]